MSAAPEHRPSRTAFIVAFSSIYIIWGSTYFGIRIAVVTIPPFFMGASRFLLAGLVLLFAHLCTPTMAHASTSVRIRRRRWRLVQRTGPRRTKLSVTQIKP